MFVYAPLICGKGMQHGHILIYARAYADQGGIKRVSGYILNPVLNKI